MNKKRLFNHQDTLRGSITPERAWWNVAYYKVTVAPDYLNKTIKGSNEIRFNILNDGKNKTMQIDLQQPMIMDSVFLEGKKISSFKRDGNIYLINFGKNVFNNGKNGNPKLNNLLIYFHGIPREAVNPPWDGGWIWKKDAKGRPWMSVACQGLGASVWYPCKDHQSDEPDSGASLTMIIPDTLIAIANGRLIQNKNNGNGTVSVTWAVKNPINNYNLIPYIGKYLNWNERYEGEKGTLECSYWVLDYDLDKAKKQFEQVKPMLKCFEYWFGPYPFYEDGYKLVESPHLGMEHQSAVAYGNKFMNGYLGRDLSGSGWGKNWDYIIVHESGHEWFGNNITTNDIADMWVHEGITDYSETLYVECLYGKEAANKYCQGLRKNIQNDRPIIGSYNVNQEGSPDMYYKGANLIHTIRQIINDDEKFRNILRGLNKDFYHQTVNSSDVENYFSKKSGIKLSKVFDQYLRTINIPVLEYKINSNTFSYHWTNCIEGFDMHIKLADGKTWLQPITDWKNQTLISDMASELKIDPNFYIYVKKIE